MNKIKLPVSIADFESIRINEFTYIDKTKYVYSLVKDPGYFFLSRPRRFGKSMLLSTIMAYFEGKKELFKGLKIEELKQDEWLIYPVLRLDLSGATYRSEEDLVDILNKYLHKWEKEYEIEFIPKTLPQRFLNVIETVAAKLGKRVVILVDEYDNPLSESIGDERLQEYYREQLHGFYSVLKKAEKHIYFCMLTGVTKFGKVSVFSGINNLYDISLDNKYAGICGITEEELHQYLLPGIEEWAEEEGWSVEEAFNQLKYNYDGYHFSRSLLDVYNPYSVMHAIKKKNISDYWSRTGFPTLLAKSLRNIDYDLETLNGSMATEGMLDNLSVYKTDPTALFYQTGYLTIKDYDRSSQLYTLRYPNREVELGILSGILKLYVPDSSNVEVAIIKMRETLKKGEPEKFIAQLKAFLAGIPSKLRTRVSKYENYFHTIFYCIASLIGLQVDVEYNTSEGFIDMLIRTPNFIYIIELKINGDAESAIKQIEEVHYADQFASDTRRLYKIGIGFSKKTSNITSVIIN